MENALANRIRWVLLTQKMSADAWAMKAGLKRGAVSKFLSRAEGEKPDSDMLVGNVVALAKAAEIRPEWLTCGTGTPTANAAPKLSIAPRGTEPDIGALQRQVEHLSTMLAAFTGASGIPARVPASGQTRGAHALDKAATDPVARKKPVPPRA